MKNKLKEAKGETLVEVLAAVLICSLSVALLFGAVMASARMDTQAEDVDGEYYDALSKAEGQGVSNPDDIYAPRPSMEVKVKNSTASDPLYGLSVNLDVNLYGSDQLLSYAEDDTP